jgi:hypothetical protein
MGLLIPKQNQSIDKRKSIANELGRLVDEGKIDESSYNHFMSKLNEAGELTLAMQEVNKREQKVKDKLRKSDEYQEKRKVSQMKKYVKAQQEKNLDETYGALELITTQLGGSDGKNLKKLLTS